MSDGVSRNRMRVLVAIRRQQRRRRPRSVDGVTSAFELSMRQRDTRRGFLRRQSLDSISSPDCLAVSSVS